MTRAQLAKLRLTRDSAGLLPTVLVPLDGSPLGERALPYATHLASSSGSSLLLLSVVGPRSGSSVAEMQHYLEVTGRRITTSRPFPNHAVLPGQTADVDANVRHHGGGPAAAIAGNRELSVRTTVLSGESVARMILAQVVPQAVAIIVAAMHRSGGVARWRHGSVTEPLLTHSQVPLLLVPEEGPDSWPVDRHLRVLLPIDGSRCSEASLLQTAEVAGWLGAHITLLDVVEPAVDGRLIGDLEKQMGREQAYLERLVKYLESIGIAAQSLVELGRPAHTITRLAGIFGADVIAMGTHGQGGSSWMVPGSVASAILRATDIPLLLAGS